MASLLQAVPTQRMRGLSFRANVSQSQIIQQAPRLQPLRAAAPVLIENRVRIRFTRMGRKKLPFYRIIAIDSRARRDGRPLEFLGWYNPMTKETSLKEPAIKKWLAVGAEASDTVAALLRRAQVLQAPK